MYCPKCGSELNENQEYCSNCGNRINGRNDKKGDKRRMTFIILILAVFAAAIPYGIYDAYEKSINGYEVNSDIDYFNSTDTREMLDLDLYGRSTEEEVLVEFVQTVCDEDPERLLHIMPVEMMNNFLAAKIGVDDYSTVLECFYAYQRDIFNLSVKSAEIWECRNIRIYDCGEAELDRVNDYWDSICPNRPEISDLREIDFWMKYGNDGETTESNTIYVVEIDGRWYLNLWMP